MLSTIASTPSNLISPNITARSHSQNMTAVEVKKTALSVENVENTETSEHQITLQFTEQELREIESLKVRDREVKSHEQAHLSAAGSFATGGASFTFKQGPNGVRYAVAGEVKIDTSQVPGDPAATIRKAEAIRRAAMAPAQPSGQDQSVAAQAGAMLTKAQAELLKMNSDLVKNDAEAQFSQARNIDFRV